MTRHSPTQILCLNIFPSETKQERLNTQDRISYLTSKIEETCTLANFENIFFVKTDEIVRNKYQVYSNSSSVMI